MAAGAITFREIAAYNSETHARLRAWDVRLIRRIDTAIRGGKSVEPAQTDTGSMRASLRAAVARIAERNSKAERSDATPPT